MSNGKGEEMKTKLYLDTSVPSAFFDTSKPMRQLLTQKWFEFEANEYELCTSVISIEEIDRLSNAEKRKNIQDLLIKNQTEILELSQDAVDLAQVYIEKGAIPPSEEEDTFHIAIASVNHIDSLVSWNFKHIVSINPIRKIHEINKKLGYQEIVIGSLEIFGGYKYGNL